MSADKRGPEVAQPGKLGSNSTKSDKISSKRSDSLRRLPPLNSLRAFEAAARLASVTAAAEELGVSHSAVSQQLRLLESYFGQRLFDRPGRRVEPTPAALAYLEDVRAALDALAAASENLTHRGARRILTISATPSFMLRWLIPRMALFQESNPTLEFHIETSYSDTIDQLGAPFDFIIRREPMTRTGYECRLLAPDRCTPLASPEYLHRRSVSSSKDLVEAELLHLKSRPNAWGRWFREQGVDMPRTLDGPFYDHFFLSIEAAACGLGFVLAPKVLVQPDLETGRLIAPFPQAEIEGAGFHLLYRSELAQHPHGRKALGWFEGQALESESPA